MIRVNDDYGINYDMFGFVVVKDEHRIYTEKKTGREVQHFTTIGYYRTMEQCMKAIARCMAKDNMDSHGGDISLKTAIEDINKAYKYVADALAKCLPEE